MFSEKKRKRHDLTRKGVVIYEKVSVVIPMYYEQEVAEVCYKRVKKVLDELKEKYEHEIIFIMMVQRTRL